MQRRSSADSGGDSRCPPRTVLPSGSHTVMNTFEELFDIVDVDDHVIGQRPRSEVHRLRLLHRAVHVFLFRPDGTLLVHKRSANKEEFPSLWTSSCSGHVSAGETYDASAPRELFEELGISASLTRLMNFAACEDTSFEFTVLYASESSDPLTPDAGEISEVRWMSPPDVAEWMKATPGDFSPAFRVLFQWFLEHGSQWNSP